MSDYSRFILIFILSAGAANGLFSCGIKKPVLYIDSAKTSLKDIYYKISAEYPSFHFSPRRISSDILNCFYSYTNAYRELFFYSKEGRSSFCGSSFFLVYLFLAVATVRAFYFSWLPLLLGGVLSLIFAIIQILPIKRAKRERAQNPELMFSWEFRISTFLPMVFETEDEAVLFYNINCNRIHSDKEYAEDYVIAMKRYTQRHYIQCTAILTLLSALALIVYF